MLDNPTNPNSSKSLENFKRGLLATTCLTVACGGNAVAGTITLPNSDFPNSSPGVLLPVGTTTVNAFVGYAVEQGVLSPEWFEFQGLTPGASYTLTAAYDPLGPREMSGNGESGAAMSVFTNSQVPLFSYQSMESPGGASVQGIVPNDGYLDVEISTNSIRIIGGEGGGNQVITPSESLQGSSYQVNLQTTTSAPEPGTLGLAGLALAGAGTLAWRRKRRA